jgi:hypothetical protein
VIGLRVHLSPSVNQNQLARIAPPTQRLSMS